jgi:hypothetical protein
MEMATKCSDYLRIILSLTSPTMLVKYRSLVPVTGVDQRAGFFGVPSVVYDPVIWTMPNAKRRSPSRYPNRTNRPHSAPPADPIFFDPPAIEARLPMPKCQTVDRAAFVKAWDNLTSIIQPSDEFWAELTMAMNEVRAELDRGAAPEEITTNMLKVHPRFNEPWIRDHVVMILIRETMRPLAETMFQPAFEALFV